MAGRFGRSMILWCGGAAGTVETITPALLDDRKTWRITHYSQDPTETRINDYDLYDLDQETLAPIRSARNTEEYRLELVFRRNEVTLRRITSKNTSIERIPLATAVQAEGLDSTFLWLACHFSRIQSPLCNCRPLGWARQKPGQDGHSIGRQNID
jgi:hypothetical protein